jgi:putative SOS response-associated peptidase YedK
MTLAYTDATADAVALALAADTNGDVWAGGTVQPGGYAPVVVRGRDGRRRLVPRQWVCRRPHGAATWSPRCAMWKAVLDRHARHPEMRAGARHACSRRWCPALVAAPDHAIMAFAGIWRDSEVPSFAILTVAVDALSGPADRLLPYRCC